MTFRAVWQEGDARCACSLSIDVAPLRLSPSFKPLLHKGCGLHHRYAVILTDHQNDRRSYSRHVLPSTSKAAVTARREAASKHRRSTPLLLNRTPLEGGRGVPCFAHWRSASRSERINSMSEANMLLNGSFLRDIERRHYKLLIYKVVFRVNVSCRVTYMYHSL